VFKEFSLATKIRNESKKRSSSYDAESANKRGGGGSGFKAL
jgi:hypothetical protein